MSTTRLSLLPNPHPKAAVCLKHMMLCKVLANQADEVPAIVAKWGHKYPGEDLEAMAAIAKAAKSRSLEEFDAATSKYQALLTSDVLVSHHLMILYVGA